jgi:hypothetical protein
VSDVDRVRQGIRGLRLGVTDPERMDAADTIEQATLDSFERVVEQLEHRCCGCPHRRRVLQ